MSDWFLFFHDKIPILTHENFMECVKIANIRPFAQLTWASLHTKFDAAVQSHPPTSIFVTVATSEDPSKKMIFYIIVFV